MLSQQHQMALAASVRPTCSSTNKVKVWSQAPLDSTVNAYNNLESIVPEIIVQLIISINLSISQICKIAQRNSTIILGTTEKTFSRRPCTTMWQ